MKIKQYKYVTFNEETSKDVVYSYYSENLTIDLNVLTDIVSSRIDFTKNEKKFFITDISNIKTLSPEAKQHIYTSQESLNNVIACAIIANIPTANLLANILIKASSNIPFKIFTDKKTAMLWIDELRGQSHGA